ncbi:MAG: hypothetical protein J5590_01200 [Clostridia bacterium]|nr:hypothetical protein [Clostridia bacterium]
MINRYYFFIHIKDLYSSAECLKRGFDPETKNLVVAKYERSNETKCLDVSASMKRLGIKGDSRLFDIPKDIKYVIAEPSMPLYYKYSATVYEILMRYIPKDAICVNTPTEIFADITDYITEYSETTREFAEKLRSIVLEELKVKVFIGIGTSIYLAKCAAMLLAVDLSSGIAFLDEKLYGEKILKNVLLKDFWFVTKEEAGFLKEAGFLTMDDILKKSAESIKISKRSYKMLCECAKAETPVNLISFKTGKLRITDKTVFPVMRTKAFCKAVSDSERIIAPEVKFSVEAYKEVKEKLACLQKDGLARLIYYDDGEYVKLCGMVSEVDAKNQSLTVVDKTLSFSDIMKIY